VSLQLYDLDELSLYLPDIVVREESIVAPQRATLLQPTMAWPCSCINCGRYFERILWQERDRYNFRPRANRLHGGGYFHQFAGRLRRDKDRQRFQVSFKVLLMADHGPVLTELD